MGRWDKCAFSVTVSDVKLKKSAEAVLILNGFSVHSDGDIFVCDESHAKNVLYNAAAAGIIVLCESDEYEKTSSHADLQKRFGSGYAFLKRPFLYADLIKAADTVASAHDIISAEISDAEREAIVDRDSLTISYKGEKVELTEREFELFDYLYLHRGEAVSRGDISENVWGDDVSGDTNITDVYISYLRRKLRRVFGEGVIVSVRNKGYILSL
ncbi:MAG: winged helix-turn-helix transcriptional regulator [Ruminococcaceae bacterium]|nr:winged helix-turn-helix transcriptional regulator [Oscillospiraceae bacterium]